MSLAPPPPVSFNPLWRMLRDIRTERTAEVPFPPGDTNPSLERTQRFVREPLPILLDLYERYGPVFTVRLLHGKVVFALGPEANHYMTVSQRRELLLPRRVAGRPDAAAGRRAPHHRR